MRVSRHCLKAICPMSNKRLLVIIPAYNEKESISSTVDELTSTLPGVDYVLVNDGPKDGTERICLEHGYNYVSLPVNSRLTVDFQAGMKYALCNGYGYALQFDADGQHRPEYISKMLDLAVAEDVDIVIGSRFVNKRKEVSARMLGRASLRLRLARYRQASSRPDFWHARV